MEEDLYECLKLIAKSRSCLVKGGEYDTEKAAALFIEDFRSGRLGKITIEGDDGI